MALTLLNCSICPKHPTFSDTSHLLTHVSSKGHLSHLHKLQVRSHQEISAGNQLATYDQWYQNRDLGRLLSERMLQKEAKRSTKRRRPTLSPRKPQQAQARGFLDIASANRPLPIDPGLQRMTAVKGAASKSLRVGSHLRLDDGSDFDSSPVKKYTRRKLRQVIHSPIKRSPSDDGLNGLDLDCPHEIDPVIQSTPDNSKLKGILWPGMDLFDAATAEMRRRRNQKKDGSTLLQMEKTSKIVEPTEVIFSEGWTSIKQRPITGMVDDSSPLKGETPVPKKAVRGKRLPLAEINVNVPRNAKRPMKAAEALPTRHRPRLVDGTRQTLPFLPSSSTDISYDAKSPFSPTEDENMEFKLTIGHLANKKKGGNFTIFHDEENTHENLRAMSQRPQTTYPQLPTPQIQSQMTQARSHIPFITAPWLQPQYQQTLPCQGLHVAQGQENQGYYTNQHSGSGKQIFDSWFTGSSQMEQYTNPLGWNQNTNPVQNPYRAYNSFAYDGPSAFSGLTSHDDVFGYPANPLNVSYEQLQEHGESPFKTSETAQLPQFTLGENKDPISPYRNVSEASLPGYGQESLDVGGQFTD